MDAESGDDDKDGLTSEWGASRQDWLGYIYLHRSLIVLTSGVKMFSFNPLNTFQSNFSRITFWRWCSAPFAHIFCVAVSETSSLSCATRSRPGRSGGKRVRTIFTQEQLDRLEKEFEKQQYMVGTERSVDLASLWNLSSQYVQHRVSTALCTARACCIFIYFYIFYFFSPFFRISK